MFILLSFQTLNFSNICFTIHKSHHISFLFILDGFIHLYNDKIKIPLKITKNHLIIIPRNIIYHIDGTHSKIKCIEVHFVTIKNFANDISNYFLNANYPIILNNASYNTFDDITHNLSSYSPQFNYFFDMNVSLVLIKFLEYIHQLIMHSSFMKYLNTKSYKNISLDDRIYLSAYELAYKIDKSILAIAIDYGFYDQSHFTKTFKKYFYITPAIFRKNYLKLHL